MRASTQLRNIETSLGSLTCNEFVLQSFVARTRHIRIQAVAAGGCGCALTRGNSSIVRRWHNYGLLLGMCDRAVSCNLRSSNECEWMHNGDWKLIPSRGLRGVCRSVWFFCKLVSVLFHGKDLFWGPSNFYLARHRKIGRRSIFFEKPPLLRPWPFVTNHSLRCLSSDTKL